jgi:RNA polymerase sigma factor (sigma-70 family)
MEVSSPYEKEQKKGLNAETYFNRIYRDTYADILKYVIIKTSNADQVEDILQNIYKNFYTRVSNKGYGDIKIPQAFLMQLAKKELSRHFKRSAKKKERETDLVEYEDLVDADEIPFEQIVDNQDALKAVCGIVGQMPLLTYKSFVLFYYYDMSVAAIAANLTINENNVKTRLWRARNAVRKGLKGVLL